MREDCDVDKRAVRGQVSVGAENKQLPSALHSSQNIVVKSWHHLWKASNRIGQG